MRTPVVTIFVRHRPSCKYAGEDFHKGCKCAKHFRWSQDGKQYRRSAGTCSWEQAEANKRIIEAQLTGQAPPADAPQQQTTLERAVEIFNADKKNQGLTASVLGKYTRELARFQTFCERNGVYVVAGCGAAELLSDFRAGWTEAYPSTATRVQVQARLRTFLKFCYDARWLDRVPKMSGIREDATPTLPLSEAEYARLLKHAKTPRIHALLQTMRWSGLAIRDAVTLERDQIIRDKAKGLTRIVTLRQKTGTHVSVPIPPDVAAEILAVLNSNPRYVFWSTGNGKETSAVTNWQHDLRKLFKDARVTSAGHMLSHRLRDTFACDLLSKGVPMEEVSKLLGHESIKTTEKSYARWVRGRQDRLDGLVVGTWKSKP